jgi:hypothetical protein
MNERDRSLHERATTAQNEPCGPLESVFGGGQVARIDAEVSFE